MCVNVARKNLYTDYSQVTSMAKNGCGAVEAGREGGGSAGVRPSKVGKLMGSNGETDKCTAGKTNNPIKKENPLALTHGQCGSSRRVSHSKFSWE